jgi:uncharacterized protein (TIGR02145 family)
MKANILIFLLLLSCCFYSCRKSSGSFTDERDGNEYEWVRIGGDVWMAENLAYLPQVNEVTESSMTEDKYFILGYYGNNTEEAKSVEIRYWNDSIINPYEYFGVLYNWAAIMADDTISDRPAQGICPCGWHIPTDEEWQRLEIATGMDPLQLDGIGLRSTNAPAIILKSKHGWNNSGNGIDSLGFAALPAGEVFSGFGFIEPGEKATFWTASEGLFPSTAWTRSILCCEFGVVRLERDKMDGFALRCVKD